MEKPQGKQDLQSPTVWAMFVTFTNVVLFSFIYGDVRPRVCLKIAFREMCVPVCGRFVSNEGGVAGYVDRMRGKYTAKWCVQIAGMNFQTRSSVLSRHFQPNDAEWIFSLQGGGMRRSGGYVD